SHSPNAVIAHTWLFPLSRRDAEHRGCPSTNSSPWSGAWIASPPRGLAAEPSRGEVLSRFLKGHVCENSRLRLCRGVVVDRVRDRCVRTIDVDALRGELAGSGRPLSVGIGD